MQAKLLRALQERQVRALGGTRPIAVDMRIIAASNVSLNGEVRAGRFRQDVYFRLNEFVITLPPLRARDDIHHLANEFLAEASMEFGSRCGEISEAAAQVLPRYAWPGNVRELRNVMRRPALLTSDAIEPEHLSFTYSDSPTPAFTPQPIPVGSSLKAIGEAALADAEQHAIRCTLEAARGNKSEAARRLRTDYRTLHRKMKQYGIGLGRYKVFEHS